MSRYTDPKGAMDVLLEAAVGVLMLVVIFSIIVWLLVKIWLWVVGIGLIALSVWLFVRWLRWRNGGW